MGNEELDRLKRAIEIQTGVEDLMRKVRTEEHADARCMFHHFAHSHLGKKKIQIARYCNQHHSTVIYSLTRFESLYKFDRHFRLQWLDFIENKDVKLGLLNKFSRYEKLDLMLKEIPLSESNVEKLFDKMYSIAAEINNKQNTVSV